MGTEHEATVPVFSLWTLWWTGDRAWHAFQGLWDAPFFHPHEGVFAFSEPMILPGVLAAPLWAGGAPPALVYNLMMLAALASNGVFTYRLARALAAARQAALLGAILAVTLPVVAKVCGALPLVPLFGILWTIEGLVRFARTGRMRAAGWAAAGFLAQYLTSQQLAVLFAPFALAAGGLALIERRFSGGALLRLGAAGAATALALSPIVVPTLAVHERYGFQRSEALVQALSAQPRDFLTRPATALLSLPPRDDSYQGDTGGLFPGLILLALAAAGTYAGSRDPASRRWCAYLALTAAVAALLALGLNLELLGWRPFAAWRAHVPGLRGVRSVFRYATLAQGMLPVLAAIGLSHAWRWLRRRAGSVAMAVLALLGAAENLTVQPLVPVPLSPRAGWVAWLRAQPESTVVAHLPFPAGLHVSDYELDAWRMFSQIGHHKPMVNGYSSHFPPGYGRFQLEINEQFPAYDVACYLHERLGVNVLVLDRSWLAGRQPRMEEERLRALLVPQYEDDQVQIYSLSPPPGYCVAVQ